MIRPSSNVRNRFLKFVAAFLLLALIALNGYDDSEAVQEALPFNPGEKFIYQAKWSSIPAGEASIEILPFETVNGTKAYHFVMKTKTNAMIDPFYIIRDREDSYADVNMTHTLLYLKQALGKHPRNIKVTYDWRKMTATHVNFGKTSKPISIVPGTFDPVALFFVIRTKNLKTGNVLEIPITDGKTNFVVKASIIRREKIAVGSKVYDTYVVIPDMERLEKALERKDKSKLKIWFTADEKKVPVKIESQAVIGSFVFELVSATF
jgi:hypothetical protein